VSCGRARERVRIERPVPRRYGIKGVRRSVHLDRRLIHSAGHSGGSREPDMTTCNPLPRGRDEKGVPRGSGGRRRSGRSTRAPELGRKVSMDKARP
jgi:hypothetical protein